MVSTCNKDEKIESNSHVKFNSVLLNGQKNYNTLVQPDDNPNKLSLFEQVSKLEKEHHFLDHLCQRIGDAYWVYSIVNKNSNTNMELVYLPFGFYGEQGTKAVLQGIRPLNTPNADYKLQLILKSEIVNYTGARYIDAYLAFAFESFDEIIYQKTPNYTYALAVQEYNKRYFPHYYTEGIRSSDGSRSECEDIVIELCFFDDCENNGGGNGGGGNSGGSTGGGWNSNGDSDWGEDNDGDGNNENDGSVGDGNIFVEIGNFFGDLGGWIGGVWSGVGDFIRDLFRPKVKCPAISKNPINGDSEISSRSLCNECETYVIKICDDDQLWWNKPWNITPCPNCDNNIDPDHFAKKERECQLNKVKQLKAQYNLPFTALEIVNMVEGSCDCIGHVEFNNCVLNTLLLEKLQGFAVDYPIINPNTSQNYTPSQLLATGLIPFTCISAVDFDECAAEALKEISQIYNWYFESIDGGIEYSIGDFDWSKHSPVAAQSLPTFAAYNNAYPQNSDGSLLTGAANIFGLLNGPINQIFVDYPGIHNVCALKVSIAINGAGVDIPHIWSDNNSNGIKDAGEQDFTIVDNDGNYYFLNAELLISYLLEIFPAPTVTVNGSDLDDGATPESSFGSDQGIYGMLPVDPSGFGASGHCDIWRDDPITPAIIYGCGAGCYWGSIDIAYFWKLD